MEIEERLQIIQELAQELRLREALGDMTLVRLDHITSPRYWMALAAMQQN